MRVNLDAKQSRVAALLLLVVALVLGYFITVHWWFVAPVLASRSQMIDLRDEEARFRAIAQQRDAIRVALGEVREFESSNPGFLTEANFDLAASGLIQRLQEQIDLLQAGERCKLVSRTPFRDRTGRGNGQTSEAPFEKVTIKVRTLCEMEYFGPLLHGLESGSPQLFVSELAITGRRAAANSARNPRGAAAPASVGTPDQAFDLYGYLRRSQESGQ